MRNAYASDAMLTACLAPYFLMSSTAAAAAAASLIVYHHIGHIRRRIGFRWNATQLFRWQPCCLYDKDEAHCDWMGGMASGGSSVGWDPKSGVSITYSA
eukprot:scaffold196404_cov66-Cyclotella_meneghiniana.AAC.2